MRASTLEIKTYDILSAAGIPFEEEYTFDDLVVSNGRHLRFDFACFDDDGNLDYLIECQGRQHYMPVAKFGGKKGLAKQRYNDSLKRQYCMKNNLRLIAIPYFDEGRLDLKYIMRAAGY